MDKMRKEETYRYNLTKSAFGTVSTLMFILFAAMHISLSYG
jgi:hypothetical protein